MNSNEMYIKTEPSTSEVSLWLIFWNYVLIGLKGWGGPVAQIQVIHEDAVEKKGWIDNETFRDAYAVCGMIPGPEAAELCMYIGYLKRKWLGGIAAGLGFMLPNFFLITVASWLYFRYAGTSSLVQNLLYGVKPAMVAIVAFSLYRLSKKFGVLSSGQMILISALMLILGFLTSIDLTILLLLLGLMYMFIKRKEWRKQRTFSVNPLALAAVGSAGYALNSHLSWLFFKLGAMSFGGAYTVLALLQFEAVNNYGWLTTAQYIDGLAINELIPGPLIMVAAFVGFAANGWWGAAIATCFIFLPAFLIVLIGAPYFEQIRGNKKIKIFLEGISAAVVGLTALFLLTLSIEMFRDWLSHVLAAISFLLLIRYRWPIWSVFLLGMVFGTTLVSIV
ncbi:MULTISPECIES: chromate efflux transporter [unclassified Paenibacillus]|uniref:chromate efflux transporter n=1 Tax=unclassified Paenibacillus TaxID=185978 RepID=UPI001AE174A2|nr:MULTISPECIES: chromate efflux transporter [unclassified Paenibacillus]MBP1154219.1 chromate transporter [Paenibacillus sp. PvP091]MBP1170396.1 chromate transporter [Paenibacillus sp. PvR098]MBP2441424.1 chromate transporter [Paenibacillus sp. PvP052]